MSAPNAAEMELPVPIMFTSVGVSLGQRMYAELLDAEFAGPGWLDPEEFLAAPGPALLFPQKYVATAQFKLIGELAVGPFKDRALATAQAFGHQREDVQAAALNLIAKHGIRGTQARGRQSSSWYPRYRRYCGLKRRH